MILFEINSTYAIIICEGVYSTNKRPISQIINESILFIQSISHINEKAKLC
jgi:hypothetical protein